MVDIIDNAIHNGQVINSVVPLAMDLFRFADNTSNDPNSLSDFQTFTRSLVPGESVVFDQITGGFGLAETPMSTGVFNGDGRQASHWKDNILLGVNLGVMDPTLAQGIIMPVSANDLRAFDLVGYEIAPIPEVGGFVMLTAVALAAAAGSCFSRRCGAYAAQASSIEQMA